MRIEVSSQIVRGRLARLQEHFAHAKLDEVLLLAARFVDAPGDIVELALPFIRNRSNVDLKRLETRIGPPSLLASSLAAPASSLASLPAWSLSRIATAIDGVAAELDVPAHTMRAARQRSNPGKLAPSDRRGHPLAGPVRGKPPCGVRRQVDLERLPDRLKQVQRPAHEQPGNAFMNASNKSPHFTASQRRGSPRTTMVSCLTPLASLMALMVLPAQSQTVPDTAAPTTQPQRVEVSGSLDLERRESVAAKVIVRREEIRKFGDTSIYDVLARVPSISVTGPGQAREIRLRGMAQGYAQILVDSQQVPAGFSLDSIGADRIERIEVVRSGAADVSSQAIAGTINIILAPRAPRPSREVRFGLSSSAGLYSPNASFQWSGGERSTSYSVGASASQQRDSWPSVLDVRAATPTGGPLLGWHTDSSEFGKRTTAAVTPRLTWKRSDKESLTLDALLQAQEFDYEGYEYRSSMFGSGLPFAANSATIRNKSAQGRFSAQYKTDLPLDSALEAKVVWSENSRTLRHVTEGIDASGNRVLRRNLDSDLLDRSVNFQGKYASDLGTDRAMSVGWDLHSGYRSEDRVQDETAAPPYTALDFTEAYTADIRKLAFYAQFEHAPMLGVNAYYGVRWESLDTSTQGLSFDPVRSRSSVVSPTLQLRWKIPGTRSEQLRLGLSRTYKPPTARDLIPRRWTLNDNSATSPDFEGNPALLPELAWGLDIGYEHYFQPEGSASVNAFVRKVRNVVVHELFRSGSAWVTRPVNAGNATVKGLELELKTQNLQKLVAAAPAVGLRMNLNLNDSEVEAIPGPGNRILNQTTVIASLGIDTKLGAAYTAGASLSYERNPFARLSSSRSVTTSDKKALDMYLAWSIHPAMRLRFSLLNVLRNSIQEDSTFDDGSLVQTQRRVRPSYRAVRVTAETRF